MTVIKQTAIASVVFAAAMFAVSCQKETIPEQNVSGQMTLSAVSEGLVTLTKTELAFKYDVLWSSIDKIYVVDSSGHHDTFKLKTGAGTTMGTFTQEGTTQFYGEVRAFYPASMLQSSNLVWPASQTNDQTVPMYCRKTLSCSTDQRMDFRSLGSVLQIVFNSTQANVSIKSIEIKDGTKTMSGTFSVDANGKAVITSTDTSGITLDLGTEVALGKGANYFNIAVPAGDYQDLTLIFTATNDAKCTMTGGKVNIAYNTVGRLTLTGEKFKADIPKGALPGQFTVKDPDGEPNSGDEKKVHFSKGNLWADGSNVLHFEDAQWKSTPTSDGVMDESHVSHFTWSSTVETSVGESNGGDFLFCDESHKQSVDGSEAIYYALSIAEWQYLLNKNDQYGKTCRSNKYKWATVNGVDGYVIAPDDFAGTIEDSYANDLELANAGYLVFLPAAGGRIGSKVYDVNDLGLYWSSSANGESDAFYVDFRINNVFPGLYDLCSYGNSVRLITESK